MRRWTYKKYLLKSQVILRQLYLASVVINVNSVRFLSQGKVSQSPSFYILVHKHPRVIIRAQLGGVGEF